MPKVSVIVTLYNQGEYLMDAFQSLENQVYTDWECIVVDDGSKDDSLEIATKLVGNHPKYQIFSKSNSGVAGARNFGIQQASGAYLAYLDSDDWLYPTALGTLNELLDQNPSAAFASGRVQECDKILSPVGKPRERYRNLIEDKVTWDLLNSDPLARILWNNPTKPGAEIWRTDRIRQLGYDPSLAINEDWDTLIRHVLANGSTAASLDVVVKYRRHSGSLIDSTKSRKWAYDCFRKNFGSSYSEDSYSLAAELAAFVNMIDQPEDDPCWSMLDRESDKYLDLTRVVLNHPTLSKFGTLWLGGSLRRLKLHKCHPHYNLVSMMRLEMAKYPYTYWVAARRILESKFLT